MNAIHKIPSVCFFLLVTMVATPDGAQAWEKFNQGCNNCHNFFQTPDGWPANLHTVHSSGDYMDNACDLCHVDTNRQCFLAESKGTSTNDGVGCLGCHGRKDGNGTLRGWGLINKHGSGKGCTMCHANVGTPQPESTKPPYYGTSDTRVDDPCNPSPEYAEDFSSDDMGLDNDGDGLADENDPDCKTEPATDGGAGADGGADAGTEPDAGTQTDESTITDGGTDDKKDSGGCATAGTTLAWLGLLGLFGLVRRQK